MWYNPFDEKATHYGCVASCCCVRAEQRVSHVFVERRHCLYQEQEQSCWRQLLGGWRKLTFVFERKPWRKLEQWYRRKC